MTALRAFVYVAAIAAAIFATVLRNAWESPGPMPLDSHAMTSLGLATNRAFCGFPSAMSTDVNIGSLFVGTRDLQNEPIASVAASRWQSIEHYCSYPRGFMVNNENSLMILEAWMLRVAPRMSLSGLSRAMLVVKLGMFALAGYALLLVGASVAMSGLLMLMGGAILAELQQSSDLSVYPFLAALFAMILGLYGVAMARRRTARATAIVALVAGFATAFAVNMRTSYLPMFLVMFVLYLAAVAAERPGGLSNRLKSAGVATLIFAAGYLSFQYAFVLRGRPASDGHYSYHVIAHPLVLSLAVPPNALAEREGIHWVDGEGRALARRVDPSAEYLGPGYERALFRYYFGLWEKYPREMLGIYLAKWRLAGAHAVMFAPFSGAVSLMLEPWRYLPGGFAFLAAFVAAAALSAWAFVRGRSSLLLLVSMASVAGAMLVTEAALVMPHFSLMYHQTLLFACGFVTLAGGQLLVNASAAVIAAAWASSRGLSFQREVVPLGERTIADFGEQWTNYTDNTGFYGSPELLQDVFGPLLRLEDLKGAVVADIGAGTGRFTNVFLASGAARVVAVEPSAAFDVLRRNTAGQQDRIEYLRTDGEHLRLPAPVDFAFSYGVLHHIPDPRPTVAAMHAALKPGGRIGIWLYGREGNEVYVNARKVVAFVTSALPHRALADFVWLLYWPTALYAAACRVLPLPLRRYFTEVYARLTPEKRRLTLYDQLNPSYAKYYWGVEVRALLQDAGFVDIELFHRHEYSWTAVAVRP